MQQTGVNACTDITGFGLLGHAGEMIEGTDAGIIIHSQKIPFFPGVKELAEMGMIPGGLHRNRDFRRKMVEIDEGIPVWLSDVLFDPQTSGGLLISVPEKKATSLLEEMLREGIQEAAIVGEVVAKPEGKIMIS